MLSRPTKTTMKLTQKALLCLEIYETEGVVKPFDKLSLNIRLLPSL